MTTARDIDNRNLEELCAVQEQELRALRREREQRVEKSDKILQTHQRIMFELGEMRKDAVILLGEESMIVARCDHSARLVKTASAAVREQDAHCRIKGHSNHLATEKQ